MRKRWAQIQHDRAHWVFEAEAPPLAHSSILFVDVTDHAPAVQEGWAFDGTSFTAPVERLQPLVPAVAGQTVGAALNVYHLDAQHPLARHAHTEMHYGVVAQGTVRLVVGADEYILPAPNGMALPAVIEHEAQAVTDTAVFLSIFPDRFTKGA